MKKTKNKETEYTPEAVMVMTVPVCLDFSPVFNCINTVCPFGQPAFFITVIAEKGMECQRKECDFQNEEELCVHFLLHVVLSYAKKKRKVCISKFQ